MLLLFAVLIIGDLGDNSGSIREMLDEFLLDLLLSIDNLFFLFYSLSSLNSILKLSSGCVVVGIILILWLGSLLDLHMLWLLSNSILFLLLDLFKGWGLDPFQLTVVRLLKFFEVFLEVSIDLLEFVFHFKVHLN